MVVVRSVLGIIGGLMAAFWLILGIETLGAKIYPPPPGLDVNKPETIAEAMKNIPNGMFVIVLLAWAFGTFVGAGIAARIGRSWKVGHGMIIGGFFLLTSLQQMSMFPHPFWFQVIGVAQFLPMAYLGARLVTLAPTEKPAGLSDLSDPEVA